MNYGRCHIHSKDILPKEKYKLFCKYFYHILQTNYRWSSMLYLLDFGKKIIIHKLNNDDGVENILYYLYLYLNENINDDVEKKYNMNEIFKFYNFDQPPNAWLNYCIEKKTII